LPLDLVNASHLASERFGAGDERRVPGFNVHSHLRLLMIFVIDWQAAAAVWFVIAVGE